MPKVIPNAEEKILSSAKTLLLENGYDGFSMRAVAQTSGIAVGTVYRRYPNCLALVTAVMTEDWKEVIEKISVSVERCPNIPCCLLRMYKLVSEFCRRYDNVRSQYAVKKPTTTLPAYYHDLTVGQLEQQIKILLDRFHDEEDEQMAPLLAVMIMGAAARSNLQAEDLEKAFRRLFP